MIALTLQFGLGTELLAASVPKLWHRREFADAVANYRVLPPAVARPFAQALPWAELCAALALFVGIITPYVATLAAVALLAFAGAAGANLLRGRPIDCGCRPGVASRRISWYLVVKDIALAACASLVAAKAPAFGVAGRPGELASAGTDFALAFVAVASLLISAILGESWSLVATRHRLSIKGGTGR